MYKKFSALFLCLVLTPSASFAHDIIIAGGGMSGISAAIQATRLGASVLVVEPTNMLGFFESSLSVGLTCPYLHSTACTHA